MDKPPAGEAWIPLLERDVVSPVRRWADLAILYGCAALAIFALGFASSLWFYKPHDVPRQRAWDAAVAVYRICEQRFIETPKRARGEVLLKQLASCEEVFNAALGEVYEAKIGGANAQAYRSGG